MQKKMKAYLAGPIFTERDRNFNAYLEAEIMKLCPNMDLYLAQNNKSINDKTGCATSADIYIGDVSRLKEADMVITIMSGDLPPIGSSYETSYYCALAEQSKLGERTLIALYDDSRDAYLTYSDAKRDAMLSGIAESQFSYLNLLSGGYVKRWGNIYPNSQELIKAVKIAYDNFMDDTPSGVYKVTNLKTGYFSYGVSENLSQMWEKHKAANTLTNRTGLHPDYFKCEIVEKVPVDQLLLALAHYTHEAEFESRHTTDYYLE